MHITRFMRTLHSESIHMGFWENWATPIATLAILFSPVNIVRKILILWTFGLLDFTYSLPFVNLHLTEKEVSLKLFSLIPLRRMSRAGMDYRTLKRAGIEYVVFSNFNLDYADESSVQWLARRHEAITFPLTKRLRKELADYIITVPDYDPNAEENAQFIVPDDGTDASEDSAEQMQALYEMLGVGHPHPQTQGCVLTYAEVMQVLTCANEYKTAIVLRGDVLDEQDAHSVSDWHYQPYDTLRRDENIRRSCDRAMEAIEVLSERQKYHYVLTVG